MKILCYFLLLIGLPLSAEAQNIPSKLKVFIDCSNTWCDDDYFRTEITVVDFYRDRLEADVHVLITSFRNGSEGSTNQMILYGQNQFSNHRDTIKYTIPPNSTDFERRDIITNYLKMGLMPLVAKTKIANSVEINMKGPDGETSMDSLETKDKWDYWVFRIGNDAKVDIDQNYKSLQLQGSISGSRVTEENKIGFYFNERYINDKYISIEDTTTVTNKERNFVQYYVKSISKHWSAGYMVEFQNSTFANIESQIQVLPALEYSIFPYEEFNNKILTLQYFVGPSWFNYYDSTIYDMTKQFMVVQESGIYLSLNQKWGNINSGFRYRTYLNDLTLNNFWLYGNLEVRITGGLSFNMYLFGEIAHDQFNLAKGNASKDEVLTKVRELQSDYNFGARFGINYRFGSKLNNFVNPRFEN